MILCKIVKLIFSRLLAQDKISSNLCNNFFQWVGIALAKNTGNELLNLLVLDLYLGRDFMHCELTSFAEITQLINNSGTRIFSKLERGIFKIDVDEFLKVVTDEHYI